MNTKFFIVLSVTALAAATASAQHKQPADSIMHQLQEVVVTARQPATKLVGTTLVSTITGSKLQDLGTALDVLEQLPMIRVQDNNVSVTGRNNVEIYIDGRPMRDETELQHLLSTNIKKVELEMFPGAAYDSTTDAVLKITTKKNFVKGLSVTEQLQLQRKRKWSAVESSDLNYRTGYWDIFLSGSANQYNDIMKGQTVSTLSYQGKENETGSTRQNTYRSYTGVVKGGVNYNRDACSAGAYYRYNPERGNFANNGTEWFNNEEPEGRVIDKDIRAHSHLISAYYENKPAGKYLLHFDADYKHAVAKNSVATTYTDAQTTDVRSADARRSTLWAGKLYMQVALGKGELTVGSQVSYTKTGLDYHMFNSDVASYIPSSTVDTRQRFGALFASWARQAGKFGMKIGMRYEYMDYVFAADGKRDDDVSRRDHLLTPDISLSYSFNDRSQVSMSYKTTTVKPPYAQLSGALNYVGKHEIEGGNPGLRDERMHTVSLFGMWNDFMLQAGYTRSTDSYAFVKQVYPARELQLKMYPVNIDIPVFDIYLTWSKNIKYWMPNVTVGMYKQWLGIENTNYNKPIFTYAIDNTLAFAPGWTITANMSGQTEGDLHTNRFGTTWFTMNMSVGRTLMNKMLTIKLAATDVFNTTNSNRTMNTFGVFTNQQKSNSVRGISLNAIYRFQPHKSKYKGGAANEAELKRL